MLNLGKYSALRGLEMLSGPPLAKPPSTAGNSLFGKTTELRATVEKIRAIEAGNPSLAKFAAPVFSAGNLCSKKDMDSARRHLAIIAYKTPAKASLLQSAPAYCQSSNNARSGHRAAIRAGVTCT